MEHPEQKNTTVIVIRSYHLASVDEFSLFYPQSIKLPFLLSLHLLQLILQLLKSSLEM